MYPYILLYAESSIYYHCEYQKINIITTAWISVKKSMCRFECNIFHATFQLLSKHKSEI